MLIIMILGNQTLQSGFKCLSNHDRLAIFPHDLDWIFWDNQFVFFVYIMQSTAVYDFNISST